MSDISWDHAAEARAALTAITTDPEHGIEALSSAQTMSNLLRDLLPDAPREKRMLVSAAEAGLAKTLREHVAQGMDPATAIRLTASSLSVSTPYPPEACTWVTSEIASAIGISQPAEVGAQDRVPPGFDPAGGMPAQVGPGSGAAGQGFAPAPGPGYAQPPLPGFPPGPVQGYQPLPAGYAPPSHNPFAITALVCGCAQFLLWFLLLIPGFLSAVAALIFGIVSLRQSKARGEGSSGLAIAGVVLGGLGALGGVFWILVIAAGSAAGSHP